MKKYILIIVLNIFALTTFAQLFERFPISNNQQLIEDAVKDGLFIVRQAYKLQDRTADEPAYYGWNNKPFFGETFSIGVKIPEGYYINDKAINPWDYDSNFERFISNNPQYDPVFSETKYRELADTACIELPFEMQSYKEIKEKCLYEINDALFDGKGFEVKSTDEKNEGWLVWVVTDKPITELNDSTVALITYRKELTFQPEVNSYEIESPSFEKNIIGGIYIVPKVTEIGKITFLLTGFLHLENEKWSVVKFLESQSADENQLTPLTKESSDKKVKENKKSKK